MGADMRRLIRFQCGADMLSGSLDEGMREVGLLCVTGGSQVRTGPHRQLHHIASRLSASGYPVFRYERRGLGDSDGVDPGYRGSGPDLAAAAAAFRAEAPHVHTLIGFGLCDGATALGLHGSAAGIAGIALANPWLVETETGEVAPAAARAHYRDRLLSIKAWKDVLGGKVDLLGAARALLGSVTKSDAGSLADEVAAGLAPYAGKLVLILSDRDNTAIAARSCWNGGAFAAVRDARVVTVPTDSHTFARQGDLDAVIAAVEDFANGIDNAG